MKSPLYPFLLLLLLPFLSLAQTEFTLGPSQGMLMTGKGPGQDGTINPYDGQDCYAIVENMGTTEVFVRIQKKEVVFTTFSILPEKSFQFKLLKDQELYLDGNGKSTSMARVSYAPLEPEKNE